MTAVLVGENDEVVVGSDVSVNGAAVGTGLEGLVVSSTGERLDGYEGPNVGDTVIGPPSPDIAP